MRCLEKETKVEKGRILVIWGVVSVGNRKIRE